MTSCLCSAVSLTLVREQHFIRIIYYCYYYYSATINALSVFPCIYPLGHRLLKGGCGIFNVCNDLSACCAHEDKTESFDCFGSLLCSGQCSPV